MVAFSFVSPQRLCVCCCLVYVEANPRNHIISPVLQLVSPTGTSPQHDHGADVTLSTSSSDSLISAKTFLPFPHCLEAHTLHLVDTSFTFLWRDGTFSPLLTHTRHSLPPSYICWRSWVICLIEVFTMKNASYIPMVSFNMYLCSLDFL